MSTFRVGSFNLLAQCYVRGDFFPYVDAAVLKWKNRSRALIQSIASLNCDIIGLQEVDSEHWPSFMLPALKSLGYEGIFQKKASSKKDGVAIVWRPTKFQLSMQHSLDYDTVLAKKYESNSETVERMTKNGVALLASFESLSNPGHKFCLSTTHLFWDPQYADVKLAQVKSCLEFGYVHANPANLPLILVGDFNSLPLSEVYTHITTQSLIPMASALFIAEGKEPAFTNYTKDFKGTLDYIFIPSSGAFDVKAVSSVPSVDLVSSQTALPNSSFPSDHIAIWADLEFKSP